MTVLKDKKKLMIMTAYKIKIRHEIGHWLISSPLQANLGFPREKQKKT